MATQLYGSLTSPFVRRLRMLMENIPHEFKEMDIFQGPDIELLKQINPINQVPVLKDNDITIWDSRQIFQYLNKKHNFQKMDWKDENILTAIEGAMAAGISLILMKRSGINIDEPLMYVQRHKERTEAIFDYLTPLLNEAPLNSWSFHAMSLYALLDWGTFRHMFTLEHRPEMKEFMAKHAHHSIVRLTDLPRT